MVRDKNSGTDLELWDVELMKFSGRVGIVASLIGLLHSFVKVAVLFNRHLFQKDSQYAELLLFNLVYMWVTK